ncbi:MAG: hypothetical protein IKW86_03665 [Salinivirgaceae bacterium]|nr:hypothetical protein [Salinivirgaceae bacterium]
MNTNIFKSAIAALALATLTFNSCKKDEPIDEPIELPSFPTDDIKLLFEDGKVFTQEDSLRSEYFYSGEKEGMETQFWLGASPDNLYTGHGPLNVGNVLKPFTKYYWCIRVRDKKKSKSDEYIQSEIRTFYYVTIPQITKVYNPEGDWATILKWEHNDYMKEATVTLTPDKDCQYNKTPIAVDAAQDSCYISAGGEFNTDNQKYAVYHQWWDDSKAQYYEPVVYNFIVKFRGEIDGHSYSVTSDTVKYIFLDRAKYAADKYFNVYRMGRIGNRTWLLEDLRGIPVIQGYQLKHSLLTSPLGFKACAYPYYYMNNEDSGEEIGIIPEGFHLATDDDWQDLEYTYGVEKMDFNNYVKSDMYTEINLKQTMEIAYSFGGDFLESCIKEMNDTTKYFGKGTGIFEKLISKNEWKTIDSTETILEGLGGFNVRPYGVVLSMHDNEAYHIGYISLFLTNTEDPTDSNRQIIRCLWSGNQGIVRVCVSDLSADYYLYRCVKDN